MYNFSRYRPARDQESVPEEKMVKVSGRKCLYVFLVLLLVFALAFLGFRLYEGKLRIALLPQEPIKKRTIDSRVLRSSRSTRTAVIHATPDQYKDSLGRWREIRTKIRNLEVREAPFKVKFGINPRFKFTMADTSVQFTPQLAASVEPVVNENRLSYPEAFRATDLKYTILSTRVKEEIILKNSSAPHTFIFEINSNKAIPQLRNGSLDFGYFRTLPPSASDAAGRQGLVNAALKKIDGVDYLVLSLNKEWKESASYPVVVDPTVIIQPDPAVGKDASLKQGLPDVNFGSDTTLDSSATTYNSRSLVQFDVSSIPRGSAIVSATMSLYVADALGGDVHVRRVTSDWDENLVTWNNQPSFEEVVATQIMDAANTWKSWDLTELVQDWHEGRAENRGVVLLTEEDSTITSGGVFFSSDYVTDTTLRPKLEVTYTIETVPPTSRIVSPREGAFVAGSSYTISGTARDNVGGTGIARVEVSTDGGSSWNEATGNTSWSYQWIPQADGQHKILSRATDLAGNIETPSLGVLVTVDNTLPTAQIASPGPNEKVTSIITISGTASDSNLSNFRVEHGRGASPPFWTQWGTSKTTSVTNGVLVSGKAFRLDNGIYTFRLIVTDKAKNTSTAVVTVDIENI